MADYKHLFSTLEVANGRKRSQRQEKQCAKDFGGRVVVASGALWFAKSDVVTDKFRIENKSTLKNEFRLSVSVWEKVRKEAYKTEKIPLIEVLVNDSCYIVTSLEEYYNVVDVSIKMYSAIGIETKTYLIVNSRWRRGSEYIISSATFKFKDSDVMIIVPKMSFLSGLNVL